MDLNEAIRTRIKEITTETNTSLTSLCLNSNLTPSTIFDFMYGKTNSPTVLTIKKLCHGAGLTLQEFFSSEYFDDVEDLTK